MKLRNLTLGLAAMGMFSTSLLAQPIFFEDFTIGLDGQFTTYSSASDKNWFNDTFNGTSSAAMNGYGGNEDSNDWLLSPQIDLSTTGINTATLSFVSRVRFDGTNISVKVSTDYQADMKPEDANWTELSATLPQDGQGSGGSDFVASGDIDLAAYIGQTVTLAFHYQTSADADSDNGAWYIDDVLVDVTGDNLALPMVAAMTAAKTELKLAADAEFKATAYSGTEPYTYEWDFGDGATATGETATHQYNQGGDFNVSVVITDADSQQITLTKEVFVEAPNPYIVKAKQADEHLRVAAFNASMEAENYAATDIELNGAQILADELAAGDNQQIKNIAQIIQLVRPDVVLINEFDYIADENSGVDMFISQYLNVAQSDNAQSIDYPYYFVAPSNTGIDSGFDLNNDGNLATADDAFGYGRFEGQYGMVLLSRYPIVQDKVRTFQKFLWKDMPNNLMPVDPATGEDWYSQDETNVFRLSSKSHWDVPVEVNGELVHILASHPTPPVFDGDEDRNGRRNHDEIRFWADYVQGADYIYDDMGQTGGLTGDARFVIAGDLNASVEGDAYPGTIDQLLLNDAVYAEFAPASNGGTANDSTNPLAPYHTASWKMRADYVLPSRAGLQVQQGSVFWPTEDQDLYPLIEDRAASSDHRLVWVDVAVVNDAGYEDEEENDDDDDFEIDGGAANNLFWLLLIVVAAFRRLQQ
ncbi:PKD domain containing protein [Catenovulum agarivorans DS-2]|uniref:PKD domain containing protein n=1 Tax=Catenovulum agarivorans DS-2 TaxID=1328313 RepID=W7R355_9ALTE|nr:endonuclease/exonuclease/phosphatase family protein [Catenovulum agarivorans]EWH12060.1 PKD domain containing protein [Catenovulum agarivorans DS-2]